MISLRNLPMKNLRGYAGRTAALILFAMLMAVSVFGGTMVIGGVRQGLSTVQNRLGADIIVTPEEAGNNFDAQTVLLQAEPGYFYMDIEKMDEIAKVDGIDKISPQLFMASAEAGCCSAKLQMIAFDPKTDFTIQPWIADIRTDGEIGLMDVVIGSNVKAFDDSTISFYGNDCNIAGQFAPTGSTLDDCVYMNFDTVKVLIESSFEKNLNLYPPYDPDEVVSAVMIRVKPEADAEQVAQEIRDQVTGVNVSTSGNMVSGIGESLDKIEKTISVFAAVFWVIGMLMTILIFTLMINERKREFASLMAMGAGRKILSGIVIREAVTVNLAGGFLGILLSGVVIIMFRSLIGQSLGVGFVIPGAGRICLLAAVSMASVLLAAAISSALAVRKTGKMDASLILKEGE